MEASITNGEAACPVPGCGRSGTANQRGTTLHVTCPKHGPVTYDYDTDELNHSDQ